MNSDNLNKWLSLGANLGVLAGIVLLAFEINQANLNARADMVSSFQDRWVSMDLSWQGEGFAAARAKAIENPEKLTLTEMIQLDGFMWSYLDHIGTNRQLWGLGVFDEPLPSQEKIISENAVLFFGNRYSQAWWAENRENIEPSTAALVDREIAKLSTDENLKYYKRIRVIMSK
jgi:hypothetical protein